MNSRICFIFAVFCFTAVAIFTVNLRGTNNRIFYEICAVNAKRARLKQQLGNKQLRLESLINPAAVSKKLDY
jgi:hypothetical protein